ncbi:hypothetical protein ACFWMP_26125 [Paenibacillus sp. NPDC058367]|uniref:hypothetical protein n=1 Tax=Paenibacillus sp. NPDC058367 TaxID=3346460 RepID=UPI003666347E
MTLPDSTVKAFEIFKPVFSLMVPLMVLPMILFVGKWIMEMFKHAVGDDYCSTSYDSEPEPKEDIYFDDRKNGYWVKMSDGSRSFVGMNDLYPNDVDNQFQTAKAQPGKYIWDSVNMKFKER